MDTAEKVGLPFYAAWLTGHSFWPTFWLSMALTVGAMMIIAPLFESRWLPLLPWYRQFWSFFPGCALLGYATATMLVMAQGLPVRYRWYNSDIWHGVVQACAIVAAISVASREWHNGVYPARAIFSPTKLWCIIVLCAGYGYVIVVTLTAVLIGTHWTLELAVTFSLAFFAILLWILMAVHDGTDKNRVREKAPYAHVAEWTPIWRI